MFLHAPVFSKGDGSEFKAYHEIMTVEESGVMAESEFLFCRAGELKQGDIVIIDSQKFRVQYVKNNGDGTNECFIALSGGAHARFK
ncbi:hypothetical protein JT459_000813 [Salmonella enterica]|nr:hypothetical protein [Salmonella enterica]ECO7735905.1 hypothetical protein [Salmonella enterica]EDZ7377396.1 hypothetical protein [Salmonella enterica]EEK5737685.1 hypothetical protein [Salmonella enterica]EEL9952926.1 hypothetical protein [Salmonella enterica]